MAGPVSLVLLARADDVPAGEGWLGPDERARLAGLRVPKRRRDYLAGRWAGKRALALHGGHPPETPLHRFEIRPAESGAPQAFRDGEPARVAISLSHSDGWAAALVRAGEAGVGCDLEQVEPRSRAFVEDYFTVPEQAFVAAGGAAEQGLRATLVWSAKEAVMKALGEGLRLPPKVLTIANSTDGPAPGGWRLFAVTAPTEASGLHGFWRTLGRFVLTVATADAHEPRLTGELPPGTEGPSETVTNPFRI